MDYDYENINAGYKLKDRILYVTFKESLDITYDVARELVQDRLRFQSYSNFDVICDVSEVRSINSEARTYLSTYGSNLLTNVALVAANARVYTMARFYIKINSPKATTELFNSIDEAVLYIKSLKKL